MRICKFKRQVFIVVLLLLGSSFSWAQNKLLSLKELESADTFTSLNAAMAKPDSVIKLSLKHKKYKTIPKEIFLFKNLQSLDLSKNKIEEIDEEIGSLTQLQELNVGSNNLTTLPIQINRLIHLKKILASQNIIVLLPSTINELKELEILDLWSNEIVEFPAEIAALKNLKEVDLRGILMTDTQKEKIKLLLPYCTIHFSAGCNCLR